MYQRYEMKVWQSRYHRSLTSFAMNFEAHRKRSTASDIIAYPVS